MKFKVEPKDFFLFGIYCAILLYLSALAVSNLMSLLNDGVFYGLFPLSAFTEYLILTLALFFGALIVIFTSVSSYIFEKQKDHGIGLKITKDKPSDGYSRWAKEKEIKESSNVEKIDPSAKELKAAGIPLINNGKEIWVDNGEYHNLVIGSTGSGKSESLVFPMVNILAKKGESMIITDPKGEIYRKTAENLKSRGYKIIILNFREPEHGNAWNPLSLPYKYYKEGNVDKATELLDDVALNILYNENNKGDSDFWEKGASDYFSGLALGLFKDAKETEVNLNSINYMSTVGEEKYGPGNNYIKEYFNLKGPNSNEYMFASTTINAPNDTKGGLLSTFRQKIRMFSTREQLSEMLSHSDFDMRDIGRGKTAVFMIIHDEKKTYHSLMTIFIKQCYETLIDVAQQNGGKLQYRTNFILDEFANMPPLKDVDSMVSAARSRDIRFTFIIQNFAQLNDVYGEQVAQVIKGNCGNLIYLISTELKALEEISKMCGEVKSKEKDKTASTPLITVSDLQKLKLGEAIIIRLRMNPFKTKYAPNFKIDWGDTFPEASYPTRKVTQVELFDLKKFVTEEKRKKMLSSMPEENNNLENIKNEFNIPKTPMFNDYMPNKTPSGGLRGMDIDAMMKDIDRKLKELDEEEAKQKEELKKQSEIKENKIVEPLIKEENNNLSSLEKNPFAIKDTNESNKNKLEETEKKLNNLDEIEKKQKEKLKEESKEIENINLSFDFDDEELENAEKKDTKNTEKPKVNVDVDSVIVNENVITDDEFFDDFFGDDE